MKHFTIGCLLLLLALVPARAQPAESDGRPGGVSYLLFPYVTAGNASYPNFIGIANTGLDPLGTVGSAGPCTFTFYGDGAGQLFSIATPDPIPPGGFNLFPVTVPNPPNNGRGYVIAKCDFPYAHGVAVILNPDGTQTTTPGLVIQRPRKKHEKLNN